MGPKEKCENVPKKHCYQIPYQIEKIHCPKDYSEDYVKPHAYKDEKYQHDTYKHDTYKPGTYKHDEKPSGYNRMMHGYPMEEESQSLDFPANVMAPADPAQRDSQLFLKLKLKTILTSKILDLFNSMEPTDPMMPVDPMEPVALIEPDLINPEDLSEIVDSIKPENALDLDPMMPIDLIDREGQNNLPFLKLKSILKAKLAKLVDPMKFDDLLRLVDSLKFGQPGEPIDEMDSVDIMDPVDVMDPGMGSAEVMDPADTMQVL